MKNPSYLAVHVGNSTCSLHKHRHRTPWSFIALALFALGMLLLGRML
jgi:hypothetical protein